MRRWLISSAAVGALIGIPALILQRWVAETRFAAIVLVLAWFALVGSRLAAYVWRRRALRRPVLGASASASSPPTIRPRLMNASLPTARLP